MDRYLPSGKASATYPPGGTNCGPLGPGSAAFAWDVVNEACYRIYGLAVTIGADTASFQGAAEVYNFNVSMSGGQGSLVNTAGLPGPVVV